MRLKHYSDLECLAKLLELGFDVPRIVLGTWGSLKNGDSRRRDVDAFLRSKFCVWRTGHVRGTPAYLLPFHIRTIERPTAWWTREREEKERAENVKS